MSKMPMAAPSPLVLAFGDSLVAGYGLPVTQGFAAQLEGRLQDAHPGARVVDAGVPGDTTAAALARLSSVLSGLAARPDLAIVQLGPNDVLRQLPPVATLANLDAILIEFARCNVPVLLTTVEPPAFFRQRAAAYADIHGEVARRHRARTHPFFPAHVLGHPGMVLADGVHPSARAIAAVVEAIAPVVERALPRPVAAAD